LCHPWCTGIHLSKRRGESSDRIVRFRGRPGAGTRLTVISVVGGGRWFKGGELVMGRCVGASFRLGLGGSRDWTFSRSDPLVCGQPGTGIGLTVISVVDEEDSVGVGRGAVVSISILEGWPSQFSRWISDQPFGFTLDRFSSACLNDRPMHSRRVEMRDSVQKHDLLVRFIKHVSSAFVPNFRRDWFQKRSTPSIAGFLRGSHERAHCRQLVHVDRSGFSDSPAARPRRNQR
jgi:hypothetical protein